MLIQEHRARFMSGLGDEQSDLQASLDATNAQIQKDNDEAVRLRKAINAVQAKKTVLLPMPDNSGGLDRTTIKEPIRTSPLDTGILDTGSAKADFITTDAKGKVKIFGLDWYIPAGGLLGLLILLRR